jgi:hypothetical protein
MSVLTTKQRKKISKKKFAIPSKAPESGSYPIPDAAHARNALARVSQHGTPAEKATVRAKIKREYPSIQQGGNSTQKKFEKMRARQGARHH